MKHILSNECKTAIVYAGTSFSDFFFFVYLKAGGATSTGDRRTEIERQECGMIVDG
jgi:hypothetical protein